MLFRSKENITEYNAGDLKIDENGIAQSASGFSPLTGVEKSQLDKEIAATRFKYQGDFL